MSLLLSITIFLLAGVAFVGANLWVGRLIRPKIPGEVKGMPYECGEVSIGSGRVQFDLRFYIVALVFLIFEVEVAMFYPWAVAYGQATTLASHWGISATQFRQGALIDLLIFFAVLLLGFAYLWRFGYLDWVRSAPSSETGDDPASSATSAAS